MLQPSKHSNPKLTTLSASGCLLAELQRKRAMSVPELKSHLVVKIPGAEPLFQPSITLLYALGVIEYRPKNDSIEYIAT